jgi:uncharacterized membrane protein
LSKQRLEAFSDGVIAILITIMVLELKVPHGGDFAAIRPLLPVLLSYVLSFVNVGIYWNNHHHMLHMVDQINGRVLWANLHLLFWLSLIPFMTAWMGENHNAALPTACMGAVLLLSALSFQMLQTAIISQQGERSKLEAVVGKDRKGRVSQLMYAASIPLAYVNGFIADALFVLVAIIWFVPDPRIEKRVEQEQEQEQTETEKVEE